MRSIADYLPPFLLKIAEYDVVTRVEQDYFDDLASAVDMVGTEHFVGTASETGIARWERTLGLFPLASETVDDRRFRLLGCMLGRQKLNFCELKRRIFVLCGEKNAEVVYQPDDYSILVRLELISKSKKNQVLAILDELAPASFLVQVELKYITHELLTAKSYGQLEAYTNAEMREDAGLKKELGG